MTTQVVEAQIAKSVKDPSKRARVYFHQVYKDIKYGRFVECEPDLVRKGYCRFLSDGREELYARNQNVALTNLLQVRTISQIQFQ